LTLGVNVGQYTPAGNGQPYDDFDFSVDIAANTREGLAYNWFDNSWGFSWVNVNQPVGISGDNASVWFPFNNFTVLYYGINYSGVWVCSNGFLSFTSPNESGVAPCSLPNNNMNDTIVAPFWRILDLSQGGSIETGFISQSWPGDHYSDYYQVFTWNDIPDQNGHPQTFQILLQDTYPTGGLAWESRIYFQYLNVTNGTPTSIGVQDRNGHHGESIPLSQISSGSDMELEANGGCRLYELEYTVTKSDSNAALLPDSTVEDGTNVLLNSSGKPSNVWGTVIEAGVNQLLDFCGAGEAIDGLFVLYDITSAFASQYDYVPSSGTLTAAGTSANQASGTVTCASQGFPWDGSYGGNGNPFDASYADTIYWHFFDAGGSQNHTITVTATAFYIDQLDPSGGGGSVSTSVVLTMYTGYHYLDIGTELASPGSGSGGQATNAPVWVNGTEYASTPVTVIGVNADNYSVSCNSTIWYKSAEYAFEDWSDISSGNQCIKNPATYNLTSDTNITAVYYPCFNLTISSAPGGTTVPTPGNYTYVYGQSATVTASASSGYSFAYWWLDNVQNTTNPINVLMTTTHTLCPVFLSNKGGGGCPYVYDWNGSAYVKDNNILPASENGNGTDTKDYYLLQQPLVPVSSTKQKSVYSLQIGEFENNTDYIDQVQLIAVDHPQGTSIAVTQQGQIIAYKSLTSPISCVDNNGNNELAEIGTMNGNVSDPSTYYEGSKGDWLLLDFGTVTGPYANLILRDDMKCAECIDVQVPNATGGWQTVDVLNPRDYWGMEAVNMTAYLPASGDFIVRLFWTQTHRLDFVGLDTSPPVPVQASTASPTLAVHSTLGDVTQKLLYGDGNYVELVKGQYITLWFTLPSQPQGTTTSFILYTDGYYT
jgi:hypothetical protein